ncbi:ATP phosphoribosyltransferase regulatory subunit [Candidatus Parcubacteria bacterium]|nr:ATP phosphoribosyltransferase regulatory subunit [Candidatus Parcubacteria bacterium]
MLKQKVRGGTKLLIKPRKKRAVKVPDYSTGKKREKAMEIALHYGFMPIKTPQIVRDDINRAKLLRDVAIETKLELDDTTLSIFPEEKISILRTYAEREMHKEPQPVMMYYKRPFVGQAIKRIPREHQYGLEILGTPRGVAEAVLITTVLAILEEAGHTNLWVDINSIGDRDSVAKYEKELANYYRKHLSELPPECKVMFRKDIFEVVKSSDKKCAMLAEEAPQSMSYLSEPSRQHFKEVLEYLETLGVQYRIAKNLLGNKHYCSHTVFEIKTEKEGVAPELLAVGSRYTHIARRIGMKRELPAIGAALQFKSSHDDMASKRQIREIQAPKFYFIQLGYDAKLKSLKVLEILRKAKIGVMHSLSKDKFMLQLEAAENSKVPYIIIMGQKEAMENSVVVRHAQNRQQETIAINDLPNYLKKIK